MTRPRSRFETIIQGFLDNVQRGNENVQRRFEAQDERDFTREQQEAARTFSREQYNTARTDTVEDRDWARTNFLTDKSAALTRSSMEGLQKVMPFLIGTPDFEAAQALVAELSRPHGLTGQQALDWATNLTIDVGGRKVNLAGSLAKWQADADLRFRQEDVEAGWLETWMVQLADTTGKYSIPEKQAIARNIVRNKFVSDAVKDSALEMAGFESAGERQRYITAGDILEAEAEVAQARAAVATIDAGAHQAFVEGDLQAMHDAQRQRAEAMGLNDYDNFLQTGYIPENEAARARLAKRLGMSDEELVAEGQVNTARWMGVIDARARTEAAGADAAEVEAQAAEWTFERTVAQADLQDGLAVATQARAAVLAGDVGYLTTLQGLQASGAYSDVLGALDIDAWLQEARDINQTGAATRAAARAAATVELRAGVEEYISSVGASFVLDGMEMGMDGEWVGLAEAIEAELGMLSKQDLANLGVSEDELRAKLTAWATRALNQNKLSETQQRLGALEAAIPDAGDEVRRRAWVAAYESGLELLGFDEGEAQAVTAGLLAAHDRGVSTWEASNTKLWQEADLLYQQTVGQYLDNVRDAESLRMMLEGGASMTVDQFGKMQALYTAIAQQAQDMVNSPACGVPANEALWVAGSADVPISFQPGLPGCREALNDANNARAMMNQIANEARFGPDGMVYLGGRDTSLMERDTPGGATDDPAAPLAAVAQAFADRGHDEASVAGFNESDYLALPAALQRQAYADIRGGASPEEVNAEMVASLFAMAVAGGYTIPDSQAPTLLEAGLERETARRGVNANVFSEREWLDTPIEQKVERVSVTREWERRAATIANAGGVISDEELAKLAKDFGLYGSRPAEAGEAVDRTRPDPTVHFVDVDATRAALDATITRLQRRGAEALMSRISTDQALAELDREAAVINRGGSLAVEAEARGAPPYLRGVPGQSSATGGGGTGDYDGPGGTGAPPERRAPIDGLDIPEGQPGALYARYYPQAEAAMAALVAQESGGRHLGDDGKLLTSKAGAQGITQVMPATGRAPGFGVTPLRDDSEAEYLRFGRDYLAALLSYYQGNLAHALAAYNAGAGHVDDAIARATAAGDVGNFLTYLQTTPANRAETLGYVRNILAMLGQS